MFEVPCSQEPRQWWDLRKVVHEGLEVIVFPRKMVRDGGTQAPL